MSLIALCPVSDVPIMDPALRGPVSEFVAFLVANRAPTVDQLVDLHVKCGAGLLTSFTATVSRALTGHPCRDILHNIVLTLGSDACAARLRYLMAKPRVSLSDTAVLVLAYTGEVLDIYPLPSSLHDGLLARDCQDDYRYGLTDERFEERFLTAAAIQNRIALGLPAVDPSEVQS